MFNSMLLLNICKQYRRDKVARLETKTIINFGKREKNKNWIGIDIFNKFNRWIQEPFLFTEVFVVFAR